MSLIDDMVFLLNQRRRALLSKFSVHLVDPADEMDPVFQHNPLKNASKEIRLIEVIGDMTERPTCRVVHVSLHATPKYQALSYMWGPEQPRCALTVDGKRFEVGTNLYHFIQTYHRSIHRSDRSYLWIDQISINQNDTKEKSAQVQLMAHIYQSAVGVIAWLGPGNKHTRMSAWMLELLECDHKLNHDYRWINSDNDLTGSRRAFFEDLIHTMPMRSKTPYARPTENGVTLTGSCKEAIFDFLSNPYWTRLWIVQEMMLASSLVVWWGDSHITRDGLVGLTEKICLTNDDKVLSSWIRLSTIMRMSRHRDVPLGYGVPAAVSEELQPILSNFCGHQCREPKDKVFGLMGLVRSDSVVKIKYNVSVEQVLLTTIQVMGEGMIRQAVRLRAPASWDVYLDTSCKLAVEMLPEMFRDLTKATAFDGLRVAKGMGIDPTYFLTTIAEQNKPAYLVKKVEEYLKR